MTCHPNSNELLDAAIAEVVEDERRDYERAENERRLRRWHRQHGPNRWFIQAFNEGRQDLIQKVQRQAAGGVA